MTTVYIDEVFLLNGLVDYLLLLCGGKLSGQTPPRLRLALAAALGGGYAVAVFFPALAFLSHPLCQLAVGLALALAAYGGMRRLLRPTLCFLCVSAAFGGGVLALQLLSGGSLSVGTGAFVGLDLRAILLSAAACYALLTLLFRGRARHAGRELRPTVVTLGERKAVLTALVDTGNGLTDPQTGQPVLVAEGEAVEPLFPAGEAPTRAELRDPASALVRRGTGWRLVPYRTVGVPCGLLLALRADGVRVGEEDYGPILVAMTPDRLSGGEYRALVGA